MALRQKNEVAPHIKNNKKKNLKIHLFKEDTWCETKHAKWIRGKKGLKLPPRALKQLFATEIRNSSLKIKSWTYSKTKEKMN